jgi:hypothetical protein
MYRPGSLCSKRVSSVSSARNFLLKVHNLTPRDLQGIAPETIVVTLAEHSVAENRVLPSVGRSAGLNSDIRHGSNFQLRWVKSPADIFVHRLYLIFHPPLCYVMCP